MKRVWKKMAALLMMLAMVLAMGTTAGAATSLTVNDATNKVVTNTASVEITGVPTDVDTLTYATYQVIFATYDSSSNSFAWQLTEWAKTALTTNWGTSTALYSDADEALKAVLALTGQTGSTGSDATEQNNIVNTLAAYIDYMFDQGSPIGQYTTYADGTTPVPSWTTTSGGGTTDTSSATLEVGAYLVIPSATNYSFLNMLVSVDVADTTGTASNAWVVSGNNAVLKCSPLSIAKTVSETGTAGTYGETADAQIGDTLYYSIKVYVPKFATNDSEHIFEVTDVATNLKIKESPIVVTPYDSNDDPGTTLVADTNYTATVSSSGDTLTVSFTSQYYSTFGVNGTYPYSYVIITYQAELLSSAVTYDTNNNGNSNTATLTYNYDNHNEVTKTSTANVFTYSLDLTKYIAGTTTPLSNASFEIYYYDDQGNKQTLKFIENSVGDYIVYDNMTTTGTVVNAVTTSSSGTLTLTGLDDDVEYFIKETVAPSGYSLNTNILKFEIIEGSPAGTIASVESKEYTVYEPSGTQTEATSTTWTAAKDASSSANLTMSVTDTKISALPATGSIGIIVFTIAGVAIMILALVLINSGKSKAKKA